VSWTHADSKQDTAHVNAVAMVRHRSWVHPGALELSVPTACASSSYHHRHRLRTLMSIASWLHAL
jgi:hypothetical protein